MPTVEVFSQGEEIVNGQTVDTNAAWLSERLFEMGFRIARHTTVGDRVGELVSVLKEISVRTDCCICTGGLGPTQDDLTAEAVSIAFNRPLIFDQEAWHNISQYFIRLGRPIPEVNRKQAMIPQGAMRIDNDWGTAPGFSIRIGQCWFAFVAGVPYEMRNLFRERIKPELLRHFDLKPWRLVTVRTAGIGESRLQQKLNALAFPREIILSFRTGNLENQTKLLFPPKFSETNLQDFVGEVAQKLGKYVFSIDGLKGDKGNMVDAIDLLLSKSGHSLAVVETVSSGQIGSRCFNYRWLVESVVVQDVFGVFDRYDYQPPDFADFKSVNEAIEHLASLVCKRSHTEIGLVQLWHPDANALNDKSGTIELFTGLATPTGCFHYICKAGGPAARKQTVAATIALDTLRRYLQGYLF